MPGLRIVGAATTWTKANISTGSSVPEAGVKVRAEPNSVKNDRAKSLKEMRLVEQRGIEPLTSALRTRRSAKLSYCPTRARIQFRVSSFKFREKAERSR